MRVAQGSVPPGRVDTDMRFLSAALLVVASAAGSPLAGADSGSRAHSIQLPHVRLAALNEAPVRVVAEQDRSLQQSCAGLGSCSSCLSAFCRWCYYFPSDATAGACVFGASTTCSNSGFSYSYVGSTYQCPNPSSSSGSGPSETPASVPIGAAIGIGLAFELLIFGAAAWFVRREVLKGGAAPSSGAPRGVDFAGSTAQEAPLRIDNPLAMREGRPSAPGMDNAAHAPAGPGTAAPAGFGSLALLLGHTRSPAVARVLHAFSCVASLFNA
jgi:hypothetical protein